MSRATKRKHVLREILNDDLASPTDKQFIVKVLKNRGNNLHEVITKDKEQFLVSMPTKFRKTFWVRRGNYLLIEPIEEGNKVKGEIVKILTKDLIKYYKQEKQWPIEFCDDDDNNDNHNHDNGSNDDNSQDESDLEPNPNRRRFETYDESSDSGDSCSEDSPTE